MTDVVAPEFARFVAAERRAGRLSLPTPAMADGDTAKPILVEAGQIDELLRVAARRASGLFRPGKRTEVVWVEGDRELAVNLDAVRVKLADGFIRMGLAVRCDQIGSTTVEIVFAVGSPNQPAGLYASTYRKPEGPALVVDAWGEALVAFAWQCLLGLVAGVAGAFGKDARGNVLVPVELIASRRGLEIVPMARHRFSGSSGLRPAAATRPPR
jgi:hypothetical protein